MAKQNIICDDEDIDIGEFDDSGSSLSSLEIKTDIIGRKYSVFVDGPIGNPSEFRDVYNILETATERDIINFIINSGGGYLHTFIPLYNLIRKTKAHTQADLYQAYSTAGLLALSCKTIQVNEFSSIMIHTPSKSEFGKLTELIAAVEHLKEITHDIYDNVYKGFVTKQEMDEIMLGKELYITGKKNITQRLNYMKRFENKTFSFFKGR